MTEIEMTEKIVAMERTIRTLQEEVIGLKNKLNDPRVRFQNLEGIFKTLSAAPDTNWRDGSLALTDISGTRKINVRIAGTWYAVTVT